MKSTVLVIHLAGAVEPEYRPGVLLRETLVRFSISFCALFAVVLAAAPGLAQTQGGTKTPPCWLERAENKPCPKQQPQQQQPQQQQQPHQQQRGQYGQQRGQYGQQRGQYGQQRGQYGQQRGQYGQYQQQRGQYGQYGQQRGQYGQYQQQQYGQYGRYQQQQRGQYGQYQQPGQYGQYQQPGQYGQYQQQYGQYGQYQQQPGQYGQWRQPPHHKQKPFESSLGFMMRAGGNLWSKPDNIQPAGYSAAGFAGNAGGFGWDMALYYEARIYQYFGLELDFGYDHSELHRDLDYNFQHVPFKVHESVTASGVRWGFLAKAIAPASPHARLWAGLGFERVAGSSTSGKVEITSGNPTPTTKTDLENSIHETSKYSTMFDLALGVVAQIGKHVDIPIDLRAAKNLSQASSWNDRVKGGSTLTAKWPWAKPPSYNVTVQSSWDFRLGLGIGYRF